MKIEINEKGSDQYYNEIVNILSQGRRLIKRPGCRLGNQIRSFRVLLIIAVVLLLVRVAMMIAWRTDISDTVIVIPVFVIVFCISWIYHLNNLRKTLIADSQPTIITLDETGIEHNRNDARVVRIPWDKIIAVRIFDNCICFIPTEITGIFIMIDIKYSDQIAGWLKDYQPDIDVIIYK